jgi:UDP-N-acetylmuramate dehydrogenase
VPDTQSPQHVGELLADHTTIRLGGPAGSFVRADHEAELVELVSSADDAGTPVLVLGGGSNLVVADAGFDGLVVQVATRGTAFTAVPDDAVAVEVQAGEPWDDVVQAVLANGLVGLETLSGIPGLTGATPIQNVGAYGAEISDLVTGVRVFDRVDASTRVLSASECVFGYRTSALKGHERYLVLGVQLQLQRGARSGPLHYAELATSLEVSVGASAPTGEVRRAVLALRARKGMLIDAADPDSVSSGSFFTNPIVPASTVPAGAPSWSAGAGLAKTSAAWLIEQAGFGRGFGSGRVGLSSKHTLALVNRGGASAAELLDLARLIRDSVQVKFGITLETEPALVGVRL